MGSSARKLPSVDLDVSEPLTRLLSKPKRIKIAVGGRGSQKSTGIGDIMLMFADYGARVCCTREFQNSIDDSVHENLRMEIERLGIENKFNIMATEIRARNGGEIFYKGLARNITSLKSIAGVNYLWIEEGESVSEKSLRILTPSIRSAAGNDNAPEIWITMNRGSSKDAIAKKYLSRAEKDLERTGFYEDDLMMVVQVNWRDNPWFPPELEQERLDDLENLPRAEYDHIWEGNYADTVENAIIDAEWFDACVDAHLTLNFHPAGQERVAYDPADTGDDKALAYCHGPVVLDVRATSAGRIDTATDWATSFTIDKRPDIFTWDCDGMGMGLKRQITDNLAGKKIHIEAFRGSEGVDNPDAIYQRLDNEVAKPKKNKDLATNKRSQYYLLLRDKIYRTYLAVTKGERVFDPDQLISFSSDIEDIGALRAELCRIPRKYNASGRFQLMSKPDMLKEDIPSPNMADAVMMLQRPVELSGEVIEIDFDGWGQ